MSNLRKSRVFTLGAVGVAGLLSAIGATVACVSAQAADAKASAAAVADLAPTQGQKAKGTVTFDRTPDGVAVSIHLEGLAPGTHGFHVHEKGDCTAPDGASAGGHYNPTGQPHAARDAAARHEGDLGNVEADASGKVETRIVDKHLELDGANSILGKAVIVHANADDFTTQPSGNAGGRIACGVIHPGAAKAAK